MAPAHTQWPRLCAHADTNSVKTALASITNPHERDTHDRTALHHAATRPTPHVLLTLLDAGLDPNTLDRDGLTPLLTAAQQRRRDNIPPLARATAPEHLNTRDKNGLTALMHASINDDPHSITILARAGADPHATLANHRTALALAAQHHSLQALHALLELRADPNARGVDGNTPLLLAARSITRDPLRIVQALLAAGADPNTTNEDGLSALAFLSATPYALAREALLAAGASPNGARDAKAPVIIAIRYANRDATRQFRDAGADLTITDAEGRTAIELLLERVTGPTTREFTL